MANEMPLMAAAGIRLEDWFEATPVGDGVSLVHEPHVHPDFRCNCWHVRGKDRDMLVDTGLGWFSLSAGLPWLQDRPIVCVSSHTHFDHIGSTHEFAERLVHPAEAHIQADPRAEWTLADPWITATPASTIFFDPPHGWDAAKYVIPPAPATGLVTDGDTIDLGDRAFRVIHTPGHSPGGIALLEEKTGTLIAGDVIYDGPLVVDCYHSDIDDYHATMHRLRQVAPRIVHAGHYKSFGPRRYLELIDRFFVDFPPAVSR